MFCLSMDLFVSCFYALEKFQGWKYSTKTTADVYILCVEFQSLEWKFIGHLHLISLELSFWAG